jgi:hypothetical protein
MNAAELELLVHSHYENQAQTLTTGAEANLLKLKELLGKLSETERERWENIKKTFARNLLLGGDGNDKLSQVIAQMTQFTEGLGDIKDVLSTGMMQLSTPPAASSPPANPHASQLEAAVQHLSKFNENLSRIGEALSGATFAAPNAAATAHQVQVIYKVPRAFLDVIKAQFQIMERWLEPVAKLAEQQGADTSELVKNVDLAFKRYETLIQRMEGAAVDE